MGSTTTNRHCVTSFDFVTVSGCDQLDVGPTHARGGRFDLMTTDVPDLERVDAIAPILISDHLSLSVFISITQDVPK